MYVWYEKNVLYKLRGESKTGLSASLLIYTSTFFHSHPSKFNIVLLFIAYSKILTQFSTQPIYKVIHHMNCICSSLVSSIGKKSIFVKKKKRNRSSIAKLGLKLKSSN